MATMQFLILASFASAALAGRHAGSLRAGDEHVDKHDEAISGKDKDTINSKYKITMKVTPEDLKECQKTASKFMKGKMHKAKAIERATDHCATDKKLDDRNYVCPQFKQALKDAFDKVPVDKEFTAKSFCELTEPYFLELRGAARLPNMGSGPLINFKIGDNCAPAVTAALNPNDNLSAEKVPDFWYAFCMNQDCAHYLPSRTRWCEIDRQPTHSVAVCEAVRNFAADEITVTDPKNFDAEEMCEMYSEFVAESGQNVEAYEHVIHGDTRTRLPIPDDDVRALESSKMQNEAKKHEMQDKDGEAVEDERDGASRVAGAVGFAALLAFTAM